MSQPYAKIIADSITEAGDRLTTMEVRIHRFGLAEFNTHRVFSRNSASSRAIPLAKQIERVSTDPAEPLVWPAEKKGMQGGDELPLHVQADASQVWLEDGLLNALDAARKLGDMNVHKSLPNRLLEPFMWQTIVVTATAWGNFFDQRCSPLAMPEIRAAAEMMREAYLTSTPKPQPIGAWHLPYIDGEDWEAMRRYVTDKDPLSLGRSLFPEMTKISAARCARVSYLTQDGKRDVTEDLVLYERLASADPPHWSPMEHVATPWPENHQEGTLDVLVGRETIRYDLSHLPKVGNLLGWQSLRTQAEVANAQVTYR